MQIYFTRGQSQTNIPYHIKPKEMSYVIHTHTHWDTIYSNLVFLLQFSKIPSYWLIYSITTIVLKYSIIFCWYKILKARSSRREWLCLFTVILWHITTPGINLNLGLPGLISESSASFFVKYKVTMRQVLVASSHLFHELPGKIRVIWQQF